MKITATKTNSPKQPVATLVDGVLRIKGHKFHVVSLFETGDVWVSDESTFKSSLEKDGVQLLYPGDEITITL